MLIQEVLFDAVVTAPLEAYWTSLVLNKSEFVFFRCFVRDLNMSRVRSLVSDRTLVVVCLCETSQELGQRRGDRLPRHQDGPVQDQPVCGSR